MYVLLYLVAIVAANVTVAVFGPGMSVVNAFLFIGFNLTARDKLHDSWDGKHLKRNMVLLIFAGSALSLLFGAGRIAVASFLAFACSESVDAFVYHFLRGRHKLVQINGSNVLSAAVDSVVFPAVAFGFPLMIWVVVGQFVAKVFGGFVWSVVLSRSGSVETAGV